MTYHDQRRWADTFLPEIKRLLAEVFVCPAPDQKDIQEATDLIVLTVRPFDIACRVRKHKYWMRADWRRQFTIRDGIRTGGRTEIDKIIDGFADFMFYGFADEQGTAIHEAHLLNLNIFRATLIRDQPTYEAVPNENGTRGRAYNLSDFPTDLVFKHWKPENLRPAAPAQYDATELEQENAELRARLEYYEAAQWAV